ncbi:fumarylacetoacetate hydrolase family protein [Salegentibacter sp. F188]|uniref:Fumarylacetoacetate hydrolase family protein n=1 Tax=Autumnicola patrickiae TaxID=3075591 RepID=A0ABU3E1F0_9FLAO|nr:fumarylacetoacetate hydrolase family protein [Salegentibacter sp. F188]MDT0689082.1 fumarylacetoacetate hydrolase family protein [Salegentibacter sp. F188]
MKQEKNYLTRHHYLNSSRWALDGKLLPKNFNLKMLLELPLDVIAEFLKVMPTGQEANHQLLAPIEPHQEVWASGVTYAHSRDAREIETEIKNIYQRVYEAKRPELFFKAAGWRTVGHKSPVRIRKDTSWNVPEPELVLVLNSFGEIVGYTVGNDVSSRDIEGENPLYLPQAKSYNGSCAIGPGIVILNADELRELSIEMKITRNNEKVFQGSTSTKRMKRSFEDLVRYLFRELTFPHGSLLMTGTGIVPPDEFTLHPGDLVQIKIGSLSLENVIDND